jgi:hypothetical protein
MLRVHPIIPAMVGKRLPHRHPSRNAPHPPHIKRGKKEMLKEKQKYKRFAQKPGTKQGKIGSFQTNKEVRKTNTMKENGKK